MEIILKNDKSNNHKIVFFWHLWNIGFYEERNGNADGYYLEVMGDTLIDKIVYWLMIIGMIMTLIYCTMIFMLLLSTIILAALYLLLCLWRFIIL